MSKLACFVLYVLFSIATNVAFADCRPIYVSIPGSCPGTTVSTKFFDVAPQNFTLTQNTPAYVDSGFPPPGPSRKFYKKYDQTQIVCNLVFDIYGPNQQPGFVGGMKTAIAVNGIPEIIVGSDVPRPFSTNAFTNYSFKSFSSGIYDISVMVSLNTYAITNVQATWAAKLEQLVCKEEWNNFQKNDGSTLMDLYNPSP